ncbi:MAG: hypothetical protein CMF46_04740 [Legionellales bacterium]|nr:hypothetical protein [Legionellales bacterium]
MDYQLQLPTGKKRLLLHSCCAPCAGDLMQRLVDSDITFVIYFYNPNIHPQKEYLLRKDENKRFADQHNIPMIDADYDVKNWFDRTKGFELTPERGQRCTHCFDMRFEHTAAYAAKHGYDLISSSLGISRWKNMDQINACGLRAAEPYEALDYWTINWRKGGGVKRMSMISHQQKFYQQQYCGCVYSLRDTNNRRRRNGFPRVEIGKDYYGEKSCD